MADENMQAQVDLQGVEFEGSDFASLLKKEFKPKTDKRQGEIAGAVKTLAEHALENVKIISDDALQSVQAIIAEMDKRLSEQVNAVLHHADFQQLEGSWRGLHHLVNNTETDETLKLRVMPISKKELGKTLKKFKGTAWDQSPLFKQLYEEEYGVLGGEPYGCLVGDYHFDHSAPDVELLGEMSKIASAAHAPFISAAAPSLLGMDSWQDLQKPRDLTKIFSTPDYAPWKSLRQTEDSRYVALTMPRVLSRLPYDPKNNPVEEFDFVEDVDGADHQKFTWSNSAYAMATNVNRAFKNFGWCTMIRGVESGGAVEELPVHSFPTDDGGVDMKCPTEIAISDRREAELSKNGFMALIHRKNTDMAAFIGGQSLQEPTKYDDDEANANAELSARLPYIFATSRFAHYLKCIARDKIGSFKEREDMEKWLQEWINNYVEPNTKTASEADKARKPLAEARVEVAEDPANPGYYASKFFLRPHYQLEGLSVSLRLVSKMPAAGGG